MILIFWVHWQENKTQFLICQAFVHLIFDQNTDSVT